MEWKSSWFDMFYNKSDHLFIFIRTSSGSHQAYGYGWGHCGKIGIFFKAKLKWNWNLAAKLHWLPFAICMEFRFHFLSNFFVE